MSQTLETTNEDPQYTGPRPTPTIPDGGSFTCYNKVIINAPAKAVYDAVLDTSRFGDWNQMVRKVDNSKPAVAQTDLGRMKTGMLMMFHVKMGSGETLTKSAELVAQDGPLTTKADGLGRTTVRWVAQGMPGFVVRAEHVNWIDDNGDGTTTFQHWETFAGFAVIFIKNIYGSAIHQHFIDWAVNLKAHVESLQTGGDGKVLR